MGGFLCGNFLPEKRYSMSVSKKHLNDQLISKAVVELYLHDLNRPTIQQISEKIGITYHTVMAILRRDVPPTRMTLEKQLRYSRSKMGEQNPMRGKTRESHHNWKGVCSDCKGYLTSLVGEVRYFVHRIVVAEALGIEPKRLPESLVVHHIDENPLNNELDNLVLCTNAGHHKLHQRRVGLLQSPLWEQWKSMTSK
jgi:hypothetical protein